NAPQFDLHLAREPDSKALWRPPTLQSVSPSSVPGSGVPAAARCHSWLVSKRFPESAHACSAWNQVTQLVGFTPATETENSGLVQSPVASNVAGNDGIQGATLCAGLTCVA